MVLAYYEPFPNVIVAYHIDASNNEYYGKAARGSTTAKAVWQIVKKEFSGSNWIMKVPVDSTTGLGSDQPKFIWDSVESLTYSLLGTKP